MSKLRLGGLTFPLVAQAAGQSLLPVADPFLAKGLPFWQKVLNTYLESAYVAAMGQRVSGASDRACRLTVSVDPVPWIEAGIVLETPMLACFPVKGPMSRLTMEHDKIEYTYRLHYVLPSLDWDGYQKIAPILQAAYGLLVLATERQFDPAYNSGANVWEAAGLTMLVIKDAEFGAFMPPGGAGHFMPAVTADITVTLRDEWDSSEAENLDGQDVSVDEGTAEEGLLQDAVQGSSDVG